MADLFTEGLGDVRTEIVGGYAKAMHRYLGREAKEIEGNREIV